MTAVWPIIAVKDVAESSRWYMKLLGGQENHPGAGVFNQILDDNGTILLCLHCWGPSGPKGDHEWPSLMHPGSRATGNGILLWFVTADFEAAWQRALKLGLAIVEKPNVNNGTGKRAFMVRDPDGYFVVVNEEGS